jgi:hypothetical protein
MVAPQNDGGAAERSGRRMEVMRLATWRRRLHQAGWTLLPQATWPRGMRRERGAGRACTLLRGPGNDQAHCYCCLGHTQRRAAYPLARRSPPCFVLLVV